MRKFILYVSIIAASFTQSSMAQTKVIAHRGFWNTAGAAKNSIAAMLKADSIDCYGSEFDVWLTGDGELVVNHDASYKGKHMERSTATELSRLKLANGENMPTLKQFFDAAKSTDIKLILELKKLKTPQRETEAVKKIIAMVKAYSYDSRMEYISFSKHATEEFIRLAPKGTPVFYLEGNLTPTQLKAMGCTGPDYDLKVLQRHPEWIEECHQLGLKVNVWTVNKAKDMEWCIQHKIDFITTDNPLELQKLLAK